MIIQFSKQFLGKYKKVDVRIRNKIDKQLRLFKKNPTDAALNNHTLKR